MNNYTKSINRIVIGDVGSGKTIVAFVLALTYLHGLDSGQVAIVAPTEVLAFQHYTKLLELVNSQSDNLQHDNIHCVYLAGKASFVDGEQLTPSKFNKKLELIMSKPETKAKIIWIGTHALLFNDNIDADLVMIDEQHRFGVRQRAKLTQRMENIIDPKMISDQTQDPENIIENKAIYQPHFLSFTATPIPRTLALTVYNSLKPHFLATLSSRNPITTNVLSFDKLENQVLDKIKTVLSQGRKVYIICPAVEDSKTEISQDNAVDKKPLWSVERAFNLFNAHFPEMVLRVHGKLADKKDILSQFKTSDSKNILVATTVIEVGVDVSEATMVVILNAERFGLSALHQIRGRVGRNTYADNFCYLITEKEFLYSKRLKYICQIQDGFQLAQKDLELRGSGDMIGSTQSGFVDEIDSLIGLNPDLYEKIGSVVNSLDFENLGTNLPRLSAYLNYQKNQVWEE